jgi:hypothetical protein
MHQAVHDVSAQPITSSSVASGVEVSKEARTTSAGDVPTAQTNFVPPASMPPSGCKQLALS